MLQAKNLSCLAFEKAVINSGDTVAMFYRVDMAEWKDDKTQAIKIGMRVTYTNKCIMFQRGVSRDLESDVRSRFQGGATGFEGAQDLDGPKPTDTSTTMFQVPEDGAGGDE